MLFKNQTLLDLEIDTGISNLSTATVTEIIMIKPDGTRVVLQATVDGSRLVYLNPQGSDIFNQLGQYKFQGKFTIEGRDAFTTILKLTFHETI